MLVNIAIVIALLNHYIASYISICVICEFLPILFNKSDKSKKYDITEIFHSKRVKVVSFLFFILFPLFLLFDYMILLTDGIFSDYKIGYLLNLIVVLESLIIFTFAVSIIFSISEVISKWVEESEKRPSLRKHPNIFVRYACRILFYPIPAESVSRINKVWSILMILFCLLFFIFICIIPFMCSRFENANKTISLNKVKTINYTVLKEDNINKIYDILLEKKDTAKEEIIELVKEIGKGKEKVICRIYTDSRAFDIREKMESKDYNKNTDEMKILDNYYLACYEKNNEKELNKIIWLGGKFKNKKDTEIKN